MKKKRFSLSLILILGIFVSAVLLSFNFSDNINSVSAYANDGTLSYTYSSETQSYTVVGCISTATTVSIPSTYNDGTNGDKSVTAIGNSAFVFARQSLTSITIPDSVTSIGKTAFAGCISLISITFGENSQLANLGNYAFSGCSSLTSIIIPNSVASIGNYAFNGCSSLTSAIISSDITDIGQDIFDNCKNLTLTLGMATISSAFNECGSLISVILLDTVTSIGEDAFSLCTELTSITIGEDSPLASIGNYAFSGCSKLTSITIPSSVTSIGNYAFSWCSNLTSINVVSGNTYYRDDNNLALLSYDGTQFIKYASANPATSYTIPSSVTSITEYAFSDCEIGR